MNQKTETKKSIIFFIWFMNLGAGLALGEALCYYFEWEPIMRLLPLGLGVIFSLCSTGIFLKSLDFQRFFPFLSLEFIYLGLSVYSKAYNEILQATSSALVYKRYRVVVLVASVAILGCIILGTLGLKQAYWQLQKRTRTSEGEAYHQLYYQLVMPKAILISIGLVVVYLLAIPVINHLLFSEVAGKPFCLSMIGVMGGAICATAAITLFVASFKKK